MFDVHALLLHAAVDGVGLAVEHLHLGHDAFVLEQALTFVGELLQAAEVGQLVLIERLLQVGILQFAAILEGEVLQLGLHVEEAQTVGQRGVEVVGLSGNLHLLLGLHRRERAHVVQAVGELYHQGADVVVERVEQLLVVVALLGDAVLLLLLLGDDVHERSHVIAEALPDLLDGEVGVLHHIVQKCRDDGVGVELQLLGSDERHRDGVDDVGLAALALLGGVLLLSQGKGILDALKVLGAHSWGHHFEHAFGRLADDQIVVVHLQIQFFAANIRIFLQTSKMFCRFF